MTDYKQLCADLTSWAEKTSAHYYSPPEVLIRARAALAEPEPDGATTGGKKPLSLVCYCYMKGMPPNPHQDWQAYFDHCAATGTISGLKLEAIQPTSSVNDSIPHSIPQQTEPEGPTLDDIWELCEEHEFTLDVDGTSEEENCNVLWAIAHAVLTRWGRPAPEPVPVAWCRTDEFSNAMKRGGSFNGWKDPGAGANKCDMRLYALLPQPS